MLIGVGEVFEFDFFTLEYQIIQRIDVTQNDEIVNQEPMLLKRVNL
jgi:hypothetical protein